MDIRNIKTKIITVLKGIKSKLKETLSLPYAKHYLVLSIILIIFFFIVTFPYEVLLRGQIQKLEAATGGNLYVGDIDFSLFGDSRIENLAFSFTSGSEINLNEVEMNIAINPVTLLIRKTIKGKLDIANFIYRKQELSIKSLINSRFDMEIDPVLGVPSSGFINIDLQNSDIKGLNIKGFDIKPIKFTSIKGETTLANRVITIKSLVFSGNDLRGDIKGTIQLEKFLFNSRINFVIEIDPNSGALQDFKMLLDNMVVTDNKVRITIAGTLMDPKVDLPTKTQAPKPPDKSMKPENRPGPGGKTNGAPEA
jgi:hypothetical protein